MLVRRHGRGGGCGAAVRGAGPAGAADFRIDDDNASAVAEICRRLDGIPLAIELAAARVRVLAPGQIAEGLSDRFRLLTGGVRGAPARQQTLEASLDWSYQLLDDAQRLALARLSVFAGSFELDAAEAVVADDGIDATRCSTWSLGWSSSRWCRSSERHGQGPLPAVGDHPPVCPTAAAELDDPDRVRDRHLAFYRRTGRAGAGGLNGGHPEEWMARLTADLDDLRAAMDWAASRTTCEGWWTSPSRSCASGSGAACPPRCTGDCSTRSMAGTPDDERVRGLVTATALAGDGGDYASAYRSASQAVDAAHAPPVGAVRSRSVGPAGLRGHAVGAVDQRAAGRRRRGGGPPRRAVRGCRDPRLRDAERRGDAAVRSRTIDAGCRLLEQARGCARPTSSPSSCRPSTRASGCGRCSPAGSTRHAGMPGSRWTSAGRWGVPGGRWSG
jgi:hypothetical protein